MEIIKLFSKLIFNWANHYHYFIKNSFKSISARCKSKWKTNKLFMFSFLFKALIEHICAFSLSPTHLAIHKIYCNNAREFFNFLPQFLWHPHCWNFFLIFLPFPSNTRWEMSKFDVRSFPHFLLLLFIHWKH